MIVSFEKKFLLFLIIVSMVSFFNKSFAKYEKIFYDFNIKNINGINLDLSKYKNKAILLVNVASYCGFTNQYADLQKLWEKYKDKGLVIVGINFVAVFLNVAFSNINLAILFFGTRYAPLGCSSNSIFSSIPKNAKIEFIVGIIFFTYSSKIIIFILSAEKFSWNRLICLE